MFTYCNEWSPSVNCNLIRLRWPWGGGAATTRATTTWPLQHTGAKDKLPVQWAHRLRLQAHLPVYKGECAQADTVIK